MRPGASIVRFEPVSISRRMSPGVGTETPAIRNSRSRPGVTPTRAGRMRWSSTGAVYLPMILHGASIDTADRRMMNVYIGDPFRLVLLGDGPENKAGVSETASALSLGLRERRKSADDL